MSTALTAAAPALFLTAVPVIDEARAEEVVAWGEYRTDDPFGYVPATVPEGLSNVVLIASARHYSLALDANDGLTAWGDHGYGDNPVPGGVSNVVWVSTGGQHTLVLRKDGTVVAWGYNSYGQADVPASLSNVVSVAAGGQHSLALTRDGTVVSWGSDYYGQSSVPPELRNVVAIAAGNGHSLALGADGTVTAWGSGGSAPDYYPSEVPEGLSNVVAVAAEEYDSVALRADGTVVTWGNAYEAPSDLTNVVSIAAGADHILALREDGTVVAWGPRQGSSYHGQTDVPTGLTNVVAVAAGETHSLALTGLPDGVAAPQLLSSRPLIGTADNPFFHRISARNGVVSFRAEGLPPGLDLDPATGWITGRPTQAGLYPVTLSVTNELGSDQRTVTLAVNAPEPAVVSEVVQAVLGGAFEYQIQMANAEWIDVTGLPPGISVDLPNGVLLGIPQQLGDFDVGVTVSNRHGRAVGTVTVRVSPVAVWGDDRDGQTHVPPGLDHVVAVAVGYEHCVALEADGTVVAWGSNRFGQTDIPVGLSNIVAIAAGGYHSLALRSDGTVAAWGVRGDGFFAYDIPMTVPASLRNVVAIATGETHSLALREDGTISAWGSNRNGQCNVPSGGGFIGIAAGEAHSLALRGDGTAVAWGEYYHDGDHHPMTAPSGLQNVISIVAGPRHCLVLRVDGIVAAWGSDDWGRTSVPSGLSNVTAVAAGSLHNLALFADGTATSWGSEYWGYRGENDVPAGLGDLIAVAASYHSLALVRTPGIVVGSRMVTPGEDYLLTTRSLAGQSAFLEWYHDGAWVHRGNTLSLNDIQASDAGEYVAVSSFPFQHITNAVITLNFRSDLEPVALDAPTRVHHSSVPTFSWTTINRGLGSTQQDWVDYLYLSDDETVGDDRLLGVFQHSRPLTSGRTLLHVSSTSIPGDLEADRDYWWIIVSDASDALEEENEGNNIMVSDRPTRIVSVPLIDSLDRTSTGCLIRIVAPPGGHCRIQRKAALSDAQWEDVGLQLVPHTGALVIEDLSEPAESAFYRFELGP